ncbi:hypothetical protein [Pseudoduganella sp. R-34]|uniref:hypothetical protein n=1 Tax=unclassified Pseudoduganella TaxID=2637179 RepID=UPI003CF03141
MDAAQVQADAKYERQLARMDAEHAQGEAKFEHQLARSDALNAEGRRRHDELIARMDRKFDRLTILILTSWLSTLATELYLHLR